MREKVKLFIKDKFVKKIFENFYNKKTEQGDSTLHHLYIQIPPELWSQDEFSAHAVFLKYLVPERKLENFFKFKEGLNFNRRNTWRILRIKI